MKTSVFLFGLACLIPTGLTLKITTDPEAGVIEEGVTVTITCTMEDEDMDRIGTLESLTIESIYYENVIIYATPWPGSRSREPQVTQKSHMEIVANLGPFGVWTFGEDYGERTEGTGSLGSPSSNVNVTGNQTTLESASVNVTVTVRRTKCTDGPAFMCVARGSQGTVDSPHHSLRVVAVPQKVHVEGGRTWSSSPRGDCDVYVRPGDRLDLYCTARVAHPLSANTATWYKVTRDQKQELTETSIMWTNSTDDDCSGTLKSSLIYYQEADDVMVTCDVDYKTPLEPGVAQKRGTIAICIDGDSGIGTGTLGNLTQPELIGVFVGVMVAVLLLFILIIVLIICCCGYRLKAEKKNSLELNGTKL